MTADWGISVLMDEAAAGGVSTNDISKVLRMVEQAIESETKETTFNDDYAAGSRKHNAKIEVDTVTVADIGFEILCDSTVTDDKKSDILRRVLQALASHSLVVTTDEYVVGTSQEFQVSIEIT